VAGFQDTGLIGLHYPRRAEYRARGSCPRCSPSRYPDNQRPARHCSENRR